jgi:hypothetical protein
VVGVELLHGISIEFENQLKKNEENLEKSIAQQDEVTRAEAVNGTLPVWFHSVHQPQINRIRSELPLESSWKT